MLFFRPIAPICLRKTLYCRYNLNFQKVLLDFEIQRIFGENSSNFESVQLSFLQIWSNITRKAVVRRFECESYWKVASRFVEFAPQMLHISLTIPPSDIRYTVRNSKAVKWMGVLWSVFWVIFPHFLLDFPTRVTHEDVANYLADWCWSLWGLWSIGWVFNG